MNIPVFVNVAGKSLEEYVTVSARLSQVPQIRGLELNVSCPNVREGGMSFGKDPRILSELVSAVRKECPDTLLIVKLTPNVTDITVQARAAVEAGANVLSLVNTFTGMVIDIESRKPVLGNRVGGLSGPAIKPIAVFLVNQVYTEVAKPAGIPIIGLGGITSAADALEFIIAGATAVSVGTSVLVQPSCLTKIIDGIKNYLVDHHERSVRDLIGSLR